MSPSRPPSGPYRHTAPRHTQEHPRRSPADAEEHGGDDRQQHPAKMHVTGVTADPFKLDLLEYAHRSVSYRQAPKNWPAASPKVMNPYRATVTAGNGQISMSGGDLR
jgi:hypothetical protein